MLSNTSDDNRNTDMNFFKELRAVADNIQFDIYRFLSIAMHDPQFHTDGPPISYASRQIRTYKNSTWTHFTTHEEPISAKVGANFGWEL